MQPPCNSRPACRTRCADTTGSRVRGTKCLCGWPASHAQQHSPLVVWTVTMGAHGGHCHYACDSLLPCTPLKAFDECCMTDVRANRLGIAWLQQAGARGERDEVGRGKGRWRCIRGNEGGSEWAPTESRVSQSGVTAKGDRGMGGVGGGWVALTIKGTGEWEGVPEGGETGG